jgi:hypothetical protein
MCVNHAVTAHCIVAPSRRRLACPSVVLENRMIVGGVVAAGGVRPWAIYKPTKIALARCPQLAQNSWSVCCFHFFCSCIELAVGFRSMRSPSVGAAPPPDMLIAGLVPTKSPCQMVQILWVLLLESGYWNRTTRVTGRGPPRRDPGSNNCKQSTCWVTHIL